MIIHPQARTTPQIKAEIQATPHLTQKALAEKYNVIEQTIRKWQNRSQTTIRAIARITCKPPCRTLKKNSLIDFTNPPSISILGIVKLI